MPNGRYLKEWLRMTLLTVGDKGYWPDYQWAAHDGEVGVEELGLEGWEVLYSDFGE